MHCNFTGISFSFCATTSTLDHPGKTGLMLGAFNRLDSGSWYFESIQEPNTGNAHCQTPESDGMKKAFTAYVGGIAEKIKAEAKRREEELRVKAAKLAEQQRQKSAGEIRKVISGISWERGRGLSIPMHSTPF